MKDKLSGKLTRELAALRPKPYRKTYSYLTDDNDENKKPECRKKYVIKRKLKFKNYKSCLQATQFENQIDYLENNKLVLDSVKENHKEFMKKIIDYY